MTQPVFPLLHDGIWWTSGIVRHSRPACSLDRLRQEPKLKGMVLLQKGSRLSVQPVTEAEWAVVLKLAGAKTS